MMIQSLLSVGKQQGFVKQRPRSLCFIIACVNGNPVDRNTSNIDILQGGSAMKNNLTQMTRTVWAIQTNFLFGTGLLPTHVFVLETRNKLVLFDTGGPGSGKMIMASLKLAGLDPGSIRAICLSHWHKDHTGSLAEITRLLKPGRVDIFIGSADLPIFTAQRLQTVHFHPRLNLPVYHGPGQRPSSTRLIPLDNAGCRMLDRNYGIRAIATPGHTPGHTAFLHQKTGALFSGCALSLMTPDLAGLVPIFHDRKAQVRSGRYLAQMDFKRLFPVHMVLRSAALPLEKRLPCKPESGILARLTGSHFFFRISK